MVELALTARAGCAFNPQGLTASQPSFLEDSREPMIRLTFAVKDGRLRGFFAT